MTDEESVDSIVQHFAGTAPAPNGEKNSDPEQSQPDNVIEPEEQAETHSEDDLPEVIEDEESEEPKASEEETTEEAEETEETPIELQLPDGSTRKMTKAELQKGILLQEDYSRKTQEIAEQRKAFETESQQIRQQQVAVLQALHDNYQTVNNPLIRMNQMLQEAQEIGDTETALRLRLDMQDEQKRQEQVSNALAWEKAQDETRQAEETKQYLAEQSKLLRERLPFISKPEGAEKFTKTVNKAMQKAGFTEAELAEMKRPDHRNAVLAYYAGKYLETLEAKPAVASALKGKAVSPSSGARQSAKGNGVDAALSKLNQNPNQENLAAWFASSNRR